MKDEHVHTFRVWLSPTFSRLRALKAYELRGEDDRKILELIAKLDPSLSISEHVANKKLRLKP